MTSTRWFLFWASNSFALLCWRVVSGQLEARRVACDFIVAWFLWCVGGIAWVFGEDFSRRRSRLRVRPPRC